MANGFQVEGSNANALFTLKVHRGEGMALLAMNWKQGKPPRDFVGFAIEYKEPGGSKFFSLKNRITFPAMDGSVNPNRLSTRLSPIQKFRWVHFPRNAEMTGDFVYRVSPVFMDSSGGLSYGEPQEVAIQLARETYPGKLNITFTRGFVSSQAFVDRYVKEGHGVKTLLPLKSKDGLDFKPSHPEAEEALAWMGFEARHAILEVLDEAIADPTAKVDVVAYDLSEREVYLRLRKLAKRLRIIIDDSGEHGEEDSGESIAADRLKKAGAVVKRHHMSNLQHNKTIVVSGKVKAVVCGSTNYTWRGFFVQNNNALIARGAGPVKVFRKAFENYLAHDSKTGFGKTDSASSWQALGIAGVDAKVTFSPHGEDNSVLGDIAKDVLTAKSSLLYSLAFLAQTKGSIREAVTKVTESPVFTYGMADRKVEGIKLETPGGNAYPVYPAALDGHLPEPFKAEPSGLSGGVGTRLHHKFVVVDFDTPAARVYLGSYNFSNPADLQNGENLLLVRDRRVATSYMVEAVRIFDHYHFRVLQSQAGAKTKLQLAPPPAKAGAKTWFDDYFTRPQKIRDRELFA
ncbi:phospholipase D-like domain-containing protein [Roseateles asaccharophilus]|uniref:phospholipase D n=1 Tax=Roseateles asaccharophilus TaxID=582607 RepID=A0ABU2A721_9BURK|nr:phospholipase D-like domain-containing protein [Roseateles asaccharophilus]MDR7333004.1 phosphatidylserine/phosphatidylglycerophosphate/cardiolipin synthase-like enzyme [Roseateles asaccharophilus]